ncbi:hypothetical protein BH11PSE9_BH11PSE9_09030 [soil metagenome]
MSATRGIDVALIYVDACLLIYQLEGHPVFGQ